MVVDMSVPGVRMLKPVHAPPCPAHCPLRNLALGGSTLPCNQTAGRARRGGCSVLCRYFKASGLSPPFP